MQLPLTRGRLNRMCKYYRGKRVKMRYEHNDSLGGHQVREAPATYDSFTIRGGPLYFHVVFQKGPDIVWEQECDEGWEFVGLGKLRLCNSGPYCHFTVKETS